MISKTLNPFRRAIARHPLLRYPVRGNKSSNVENLYSILTIKPTATKEEIEQAFMSKAKYYDPDITGDNSHTQVFEELKLAYNTLINDKTRTEYDEYLASVGTNRGKVQEELDPEEIERRKRERGKQRFMEDYDFVNEEFFNMWKQRTASQGAEKESGSSNETALNFDGQNI